MPAIPSSSLGSLIRRYRMAAGLTQEELAGQAGLSVRAVSNLERGSKHRPRRATIELLAEALGLEATEREGLEAAARPPAALPALDVLRLEHGGGVPVPLTPLVGREEERVQLSRLLRRPDVRLVTLTGPAGVGKTRVAVQVAADLHGDFPGGVCFVPLATTRDSSAVLPAIAGALGVVEVAGTPLLRSLLAQLHSKRMLLLLDNFEQVVEAAPVVADLLSLASDLNILVTSRAVLRLSAERVYQVPPLSLPDRHGPPRVERLPDYGAVALFLLRAQAARAGFTLTTDNAAAVVEVCHRLDGLPLALELAAARSRSMSPQTMLAHLTHRLSVLTEGPRDVPSRQQSLRAALDWSYALLNPAEQTLFARLGVFVGGCTAEAVEAVVNAAGVPLRSGEDVLTGLEALIDESLLSQAGDANRLRGDRFVMLETIREYALEHLIRSGQAESMRVRHAAYYLHLAEHAQPHLRGSEQSGWLALLEEEHDNLRAALQWADQHGESEIGLRLAAALWRFWHRRGHLGEGRRWVETMLDRETEGADTVRAAALNGAGVLAQTQGDYARARGWHQQSLVLHRALGDSRGVAWSLNNLALIASAEEDYGEAMTLLEESLAISRDLHDREHVAMALTNLGDAALRRGELERANGYLRESHALWQELGSERGLALVLCNRGTLALHVGEEADALELLRQSLQLCAKLGHKVGIAECLEKTGWVLVTRDPQDAIRLWGAAEMVRADIGEPLEPHDRAAHDRYLARASALLPASDTRFWEEGRAMTVEEAISFALAHTGTLPLESETLPAGG